MCKVSEGGDVSIFATGETATGDSQPELSIQVVTHNVTPIK